MRSELADKNSGGKEQNEDAKLGYRQPFLLLLHPEFCVLTSSFFTLHFSFFTGSSC